MSDLPWRRPCINIGIGERQTKRGPREAFVLQTALVVGRLDTHPSL